MPRQGFLIPQMDRRDPKPKRSAGSRDRETLIQGQEQTIRESSVELA